MFSLASGIYQSYFATPQLTVLLIGAEGVGKTTLLERLKVTQFSKQPSASNNTMPAQLRRTISCPAPLKYANAKVLDDEEYHEEEGEPASNLGSNFDRPMASKRWLEERQQSSMEEIEWSTKGDSFSRLPIAEEKKEQSLVEMKKVATSCTEHGSDCTKEYNVKSGQKMLPMEKIRPTSGQNLAKIDICGAKCHIFDISGKFSDLWERYYGDAEAVIYCWHLQKEEADQRALLEEVRAEIPDDVPILIFGHVTTLPLNIMMNNDDGADDDDLPTMSTAFFLPNYHSNLMQVYLGNAKNGKGVREAMEWLVPMAKRQAKSRAQAAALAAAAANETTTNNGAIKR